MQYRVRTLKSGFILRLTRKDHCFLILWVISNENSTFYIPIIRYLSIKNSSNHLSCSLSGLATVFLPQMVNLNLLKLLFLAALTSNNMAALRLRADATQRRRLSTFASECSASCPNSNEVAVDLLLKKGLNCPKTIQETEKFITGGGIHICRALRGEVKSTQRKSFKNLQKKMSIAELISG